MSGHLGAGIRQPGEEFSMVVAGVVTFLVGVLCIALSLTYVASSALLLFGIIIAAGGVVLLYLAAKSG